MFLSRKFGEMSPNLTGDEDIFSDGLVHLPTSQDLKTYSNGMVQYDDSDEFGDQVLKKLVRQGANLGRATHPKIALPRS